VRAPEGVGGELFFQKHADPRKLRGVQQLDPALSAPHPPMLAMENVEGLQTIAQWNVIEVHTQNAVASSFSQPDRMVFDIDPGEGVQWPQIQEAATVLQVFLGDLGLKPFLKTSGGKGLHVVVPIKRDHGWDTVKDFSQAVVAHLARAIPQRFVLKSGPKNRVGKIFIDYLRNGQGATTVAAWSVRARPGLGVSVPVDWSELAGLQSGAHWTVQTVQARMDLGNAPWDAYANSAVRLTKAMKLLNFKPDA
jgi:bifunctional non-homologous end joining protein LigD